jgi:DNA-3-methyladenine glycosylase
MLLPRSFYADTDVVQTAQHLLGKILVTDYDGVRTSGRIVETEAYRAPDDFASHATKFPNTARGKSMFVNAGTAYVFYCRYHPLFNIITAPEHLAHCVLVRAIEPLEGVDTMYLRRPHIKKLVELTNGPGKFTHALGISVEKSHHTDLCIGENIWLEDDGCVVENPIVTPRIRVDGAGKEAAERLWRFYTPNNIFVSEKRYFSKNNFFKKEES